MSYCKPRVLPPVVHPTRYCEDHRYSISKGKSAGTATACGLCTGLVVHITAAAAGISAAIYQSAVAFSIVKYAGAAYLLFLAYQSFRRKSAGFTVNEHLRCHAEGAGMNKLRKKGKEEQ